MEKIYLNRLKTLALHLKAGHLKTPVEAITDDIFIEETPEYIEVSIPFFVYPIRELPFLFKNEWRTDTYGYPYWVKDPEKNPVGSTILFFGLSFPIFQHLFIATGQNIEMYGGKVLGKSSSPQQIAHNMLELIKIVEGK